MKMDKSISLSLLQSIKRGIMAKHELQLEASNLSLSLYCQDLPSYSNKLKGWLESQSVVKCWHMGGYTWRYEFYPKNHPTILYVLFDIHDNCLEDSLGSVLIRYKGDSYLQLWKDDNPS